MALSDFILLSEKLDLCGSDPWCHDTLNKSETGCYLANLVQRNARTIDGTVAARLTGRRGEKTGALSKLADPG